VKTYKVVLTPFPDGQTNPDVLELENLKDINDYVPCAPDNFIVGEIVSENEIELVEANFVDDNGVGVGMFAVKKRSLNEVELLTF